MDYNRLFDQNADQKFFYSDYPGRKLVVGNVSLKNAMARLTKDEYYVLVTYKEGEKLPQQYRPLNDLTSEDGTLFATISDDVYTPYICRDGGIQRISNLANPGNSANYLLGPGPDTVLLDDLIAEQYEEYKRQHSKSK